MSRRRILKAGSYIATKCRSALKRHAHRDFVKLFVEEFRARDNALMSHVRFYRINLTDKRLENVRKKY